MLEIQLQDGALRLFCEPSAALRWESFQVHASRPQASRVDRFRSKWNFESFKELLKELLKSFKSNVSLSEVRKSCLFLGLKLS